MIRLSIHRPIATSMAYLAVALLGIAAWRNIPIELLPDTSLPRLIVTASLSGASPETTEALLTAPLEGTIQQLRGVARITSESYEANGRGQARVAIEFDRRANMDFARLELAERLAALENRLPSTASRPQISRYVPREFRDHARPFLEYSVTGPYTLEALRLQVEEKIAPELRRLEGIGEVTIVGGRARLLEIELDESRLHALGLTPEAVHHRLAQLEYIRQAGVVESQGRLHTLAIRHRTDSIDEIRNLPILTDNHRLVRLGDVAQLHDTFEDPHSIYRIDGRPALSFTIHREAGSNAIAVADRVNSELPRLEAALQPGIDLILDHDEGEEIRAHFSDLRTRALVSAGVVLIILILFLRSIASATVILATIAFSVLITLNLIYVGGHTLNLLTLMGLAMGFGLIVDNAIVVLENIHRLRARGLSASEAAEVGTSEVVLAILASTLTTLVVLIPFLYLQGELRAYYVPLAIVVGFSLFASLFVAFTFIPAIASKIFGRAGRPDPRRDRVDDVVVPGPIPLTSVPAPAGAAESGALTEDALPPPRQTRPIYTRAYAAILSTTLRHPWAPILLASLAFGASYYAFDKKVARGVLWGGWGGSDSHITIQIRLPRGAEISRTDELARHFEDRVRAIPAVERFVTRVRPEFADIRITFPDSLAHTGLPIAIKENLTAYSHEFGGAEIRVYGYGPSFYGGGGGAPNYHIRVFGYDYETVREIAEEIAYRLSRFPRIHEVDPNATDSWYEDEKATEFALAIDRSRLALHDLTTRDLVSQVAAAVGGEARGVPVRIGGEEVELAIDLAGSRDLDLHGLHELLIHTPTGEAVRLAELVEVEEREIIGRIIRENQQYQRSIAYVFRGPPKLGDRTHEAIMKSTLLPPGYTLEGRQEWHWADDERSQLYQVLAVSIALVFIVAAALFESVRLPLCILLTLPMALIGVFLTFLLVDATFTREAYVGVIMMGGIVVNNSILLVDQINRLRRSAGLTLRAAIIEGSLDRARPILMTSATTILGLAPLVLFGGSADSRIWNALGYALIGGLATSTILVLTLTPALYLLLERRGECSD